jgi:uncharacterized membrane protein
LICKNCGSEIVADTVGTPGGCNPIPLPAKVDSERIVIEEAALEGGVRVFRKK